MKNYLNYQTSEYDCGPTTLLNAIRYLFDREIIPPDLIKAISMYSLDAFDENGESGKSGTSRWAMVFLSNWFNQFGDTRNFPLNTEMLLDEQVSVTANSKVIECLQLGGVAILCVWLGDCKHYILVTGVDIQKKELHVFDPYVFEEPVNGTTVQNIEGFPKEKNRVISIETVSQLTHEYYALGEPEGREAMLLYNTSTKTTPEKTIEFFI